MKGNYDDLWYMAIQWNRRRKYRDVTSDNYDPFKGKPGRKPIKVREIKKTPEQTAAQSIRNERDEKIASLRTKVAALIANRNLPEAAQTYLEIVNIDKEHFLPRQHQLDVANQLMSMGLWSESAGAYEKFLTHYNNYEYVEQVQLMLGILYSRYLEKTEQAIKYLTSAKEKLSNPDQIKMCESELSRLKPE